MHKTFATVHMILFEIVLRYFCQVLQLVLHYLFIITKDVTVLAFVFKKLSIFNQHALDFTVGRPYYLKMAQLNCMENVGCVREDREQTHRSTASLAQSLQSSTTGSILDSWLCFPLFCIGSSLNGTRGKRVPVHFSSTSPHYLNAAWPLSSPYL